MFWALAPAKYALIANKEQNCANSVSQEKRKKGQYELMVLPYSRDNNNNTLLVLSTKFKAVLEL
jgi:hypothetical protein